MANEMPYIVSDVVFLVPSLLTSIIKLLISFDQAALHVLGGHLFSWIELGICIAWVAILAKTSPTLALATWFLPKSWQVSIEMVKSYENRADSYRGGHIRCRALCL